MSEEAEMKDVTPRDDDRAQEVMAQEAAAEYDIKEQIKVVVEARKEALALSDKRKAIYDAFISEHTDFFAHVASAASRAAEAEVKLRQLTIDNYFATEEKAPAPGVGVRVMERLEYDPKVALDWAKAHKMALMLDQKAFEKICKADKPDFVAIIPDPIATIAADLKVVL